MLARISASAVLLAASCFVGCSPGLVTEEDKTDAVVAKANAEAAAKPKYSDGAVARAALDGKKTVVERALKDGNALSAISPDGFSTLYLAALGGHLEIFRLLLDGGAEPDVRAGQEGLTPLHGAALGGNIKIMSLLLDAGLEIDDRTGGKKMSILHLAAYSGKTDAVRFLLEREMDVDQRDDEGKSALMHAASGPFAETVEVLLDAGADINLTEHTESFTPLMTAAAEGHLDVVKLLMSRGADPSMLDKDGDSALSFARQRRNSEVVAFLSAANKSKESPKQTPEETETTE